MTENLTKAAKNLVANNVDKVSMAELIALAMVGAKKIVTDLERNKCGLPTWMEAGYPPRPYCTNTLRIAKTGKPVRHCS